MSVFPENVDIFNILSDITENDIGNKKEYNLLMNMTDQEREDYPATHDNKTWVQRIDELVVLLQGKILMSADITELQNAILNMQEYILEKIPQIEVDIEDIPRILQDIEDIKEFIEYTEEV